MAKTIAISAASNARVNLSINPLDGDMALMVSYSLVDASGAVVQNKTVDATKKLSATQRTALANAALNVFNAVKTDEGV